MKFYMTKESRSVTRLNRKPSYLRILINFKYISNTKSMQVCLTHIKMDIVVPKDYIASKKNESLRLSECRLQI